MPFSRYFAAPLFTFRERLMIPSNSFFVRCLLLTFAGLFFGRPIRAQIPYAYDPAVDSTSAPLREYHGSDIDSVELASGTVSLKIPLISYPQRGEILHLDLSLSYFGNTGNPNAAINQFYVPNGRGLQVWQESIFGQTHSLSSATFTITYENFPNVTLLHTQTGTSSSTTQGWIVEANGSAHPLGFTSTTQGRSLDGTGFFANGLSTPYTVVDKNGVVTSYVSGSNLTTDTDPNGNQMVFNFSNSTITDTMGRQVLGLLSSPWTVPGVNGGSENFVLGGSGTSQTLTLPNNTSYSFQFTTTALPLLQKQTTAQTIALLTKVALPTGGSISYSYSTTFTTTACSGGSNWYFPLLKRIVDSNDGTGPHTWTYSYQTSSTSSATTTVIDPLGNKTVYTYGLTSCQPYPTQIQKYDNSGNLLQTETRTYTVTGSVQGVYLDSDTIQWSNNQESQKTYTYDRDNGHSFQFGSTLCFNYPNTYICNGLAGAAGYSDAPWSVTETDYGAGSPGAVLRQTKTTFMPFNGPNASSYLANNLLTKPYTVQVLNGSNGQMALTQYNYDESALASSGLSSAYQWTSTPPAGTYRGNNTSIYRWLNSGTLTCQNGKSAGTGANVTSKITYFDTGTVQISADPCGNTTTFAYSNTYWGAYATTVTNPLSQITSHTYDFNTGLLASTTDPNLLVTSYTYDSMWRLYQAFRPDGGVDTITHQESSFPFSATRTSAINPSQNKVETNIFDGLGRISERQLSSDPQGTVYADTTYDALGRVSTLSNPYRKGTDITTTAGSTTYSYDALNRKTLESYPDGSALSTVYCGPSTLVTDPTKRWRRSRIDGLGRLVEVDEPNSPTASVNPNGCPGTGEPIWVTSYTVDALNNLTNVVQNGSHQRSFTFDSLSRLVCSSNPENSSAPCPAFGATSFPSGTLAYIYYPDGPISSRTDSRTIRTSYTYDPLHRELTRTYSDGTPTVTTGYDQTGCLGLSACQNIGHRTSMTDAAGSASWAFQADQPNSRSLIKAQRTSLGINKTSTYILDLKGNTTQVTYPTSRIVNFTFDSANRPSTAQDASNGITYATGFKVSSGGTCINSVACYTPEGTFYALSIGQTSAFTGVNLTHIYNNRLQPLEFKASSSGGSAIDVSYSYIDPSAGGNAGHVFSITNNLDSSRSQTFSYDQLNRIASAQTTSTFSTSPAHCWGEVYGFDAWSNLLSVTPTTNSAYSGCANEAGFSKSADGGNHLSGFSYDTFGNTTFDGLYTYVWDGESQLKSAAGVNYTYDGDSRRIAKIGSKLYWYDGGSEILGETDTSGNTTAEYVFFGGKRIAMLPAGSNPTYYIEDLLGTSRVLTTNAGVVCYDADFYPYGGERSYSNTCPQNYKFEGKERDAETGNDAFGARYYSNLFGRWLSADWSNIPTPVPYANVTNPQTLNLYAMVADDPESFADLDGHQDAPEVDPKEEGEGEVREDKELTEVLNRAEEALSARKEAAEAAAREQFAQTHPEGWDDPLTGECYAPRPGFKPGTKGDPNHAGTAQQVADSMDPKGETEVKVLTPGGKKGFRRIDAANRDQNGDVKDATQVIRPLKNGGPPKRERDAADDLAKQGIKVRFVPVRPIIPKPKIDPLLPPNMPDDL